MNMGLNGEPRDACWGRDRFRGYVSRYVSGYVSGVCFGYVSRHHELLCLQFRGYVTVYVSGVCFVVCYGVCFAGATRVPFLNLSPTKNTHTHM